MNHEIECGAEIMPKTESESFLKRLADTISAEIADPAAVVEIVGEARFVRIDVTKLAERIEALYRDRIAELEDELDNLGYALKAGPYGD